MGDTVTRFSLNFPMYNIRFIRIYVLCMFITVQLMFFHSRKFRGNRVTVSLVTI
jgi:hypothetical protein